MSLNCPWIPARVRCADLAGMTKMFVGQHTCCLSGRIPPNTVLNTGGVHMVLFVELREGLQIDEVLRDRIRTVIRDNATPRHVPTCRAP